MFFTIEPMVNAGKFPVKLLDDGWTAVTATARFSQFEHSLAITEDGNEIFTLSPAASYAKLANQGAARPPCSPAAITAIGQQAGHHHRQEVR